MHQTLRAHLIYLHEKLQELTDLLTQPVPDAERADLEARIRLVHQSLEHYRRAYEMESAIREGLPPGIVPQS